MKNDLLPELEALENQIKSVMSHPEYLALVSSGFYVGNVDLTLTDALQAVKDAIESHNYLKTMVDQHSVLNRAYV